MLDRLFVLFRYSFFIYYIIGFVFIYSNICSVAFALQPSEEQTKEAPLSEEGLVVSPKKKATLRVIDPSWVPLLEKLKSDEPSVSYDRYFRGLEPYSPSPMSVKIKELYSILTRPKTPLVTNGIKNPPPTVYKGFVTSGTVKKCKEFLAKNKSAFDLMEKRYNVPRAIVVSLLYVETKLGTFLGKEKAFWSLASMAMADRPERTIDGIAPLNIKEEHQAWLQSKLTDKSSWAYKELKALLNYSIANGVDPQSIQGSVYGAIGICQFMPSNIPLFGDDGTGNGKIDLFNESDAIVSVGRYFAGHGWKGRMTESSKRKVIKRYNNLTRYANTILALSSSITTGKIPGESHGKKVRHDKKGYSKVKKNIVKYSANHKKAQIPQKSIAQKK